MRVGKEDESLTGNRKGKVTLHRSIQCVLGGWFTTWVACVLNGEEVSKSGWTLGWFKEKLPEATSAAEVRER